MSDFNASDTRQVRAAVREAKAREAERKLVVMGLMSSPAGRAYIHDRLLRCHVFHTTFSDSTPRMAFAEGERNVGLQDLADVMAFAPDQYVQMLREANDKEIANARRSDSTRPANGNDGSSPDLGRDHSGQLELYASDYDPAPDPSGDDAAN